jgi:hypothetical protein
MTALTAMSFPLKSVLFSKQSMEKRPIRLIVRRISRILPFSRAIGLKEHTVLAARG